MKSSYKLLFTNGIILLLCFIIHLGLLIHYLNKPTLLDILNLSLNLFFVILETLTMYNVVRKFLNSSLPSCHKWKPKSWKNMDVLYLKCSTCETEIQYSGYLNVWYKKMILLPHQ